MLAIKIKNIFLQKWKAVMECTNRLKTKDVVVSVRDCLTLKHGSWKWLVARIALSVLLLTMGGLIYIAYREQSLLLFRWLDALGLNEEVSALRRMACAGEVFFWVKYNLPAGLWLLSYMLMVDAVWTSSESAVSYVFVYALPFLALLSEVLQHVGWLPGVFDWMDVCAYVCAICLFELFKFLK